MLPSDAVLQLPRREFQDSADYKFQMMAVFSESFDAAQSALMKSQEQQKAYYDRKITTTDYRIGDLKKVYVFSPVIKPGCTKKLTRRFHGPYRVLLSQAPKLLLRPYHKRHGKTTWTHVNRVKPCYLEHVPDFVQPSHIEPTAFEIDYEETEENIGLQEADINSDTEPTDEKEDNNHADTNQDVPSTSLVDGPSGNLPNQEMTHPPELEKRQHRYMLRSKDHKNADQAVQKLESGERRRTASPTHML